MGGGYYQLRAGFGQFLLYAGSAGWAVSAPTGSVKLSGPSPGAPALGIAVGSFRPREFALRLSCSRTRAFLLEHHHGRLSCSKTRAFLLEHHSKRRAFLF